MGAPALRLSLSARRRGPAADGGRQRAAVSRRAVPACQSAHPETDAASGQRAGQSRPHPRLARDLSRAHDPLDVHRRLSRRNGSRVRGAARISAKRPNSTASVVLPIRRSRARRRTRCPIRFPRRSRKSGARASWRRRQRSALAVLPPRSGARSRCWSIRSSRGRAIARSAADAPEIDGIVIIEDGRALAVGEFVRVRVVGSGEHDLTRAPRRLAAASAQRRLTLWGGQRPQRGGELLENVTQARALSPATSASADRAGTSRRACSSPRPEECARRGACGGEKELDRHHGGRLRRVAQVTVEFAHERFEPLVALERARRRQHGPVEARAPQATPRSLRRSSAPEQPGTRCRNRLSYLRSPSR